MGFLLGLASSVAANIIFWLLLGIVFWAASTVVARRFSRFFGLYNIRSIAVYLSNLWSPEQSRREKGYTISLHELRAAQSVDQLFASAPLRLPELVRGLVDAVWLRHPVRCVVEVSPPGTESVDLDRNLVIVGSSARNSLRASYIRTGVPSAFLTDEIDASNDRPDPSRERSISILRNGRASEVILQDANLALVEKCRDPDRGTTLFFCLGLRGDSTWAATEYLVRNWKRLDREFGDSSFVVCLGFPLTEEYLEEYREPLRLTIGMEHPIDVF
jgi:hypothetical protein